MFLRSLSLRGFKSFANKSVLKFEPGITAIVGPNGSGKSNITDAVLWVLGEQSARTLRGSTMQDVIFAGSTTRQSLGIAEVSLVLDNSDGTIPIEFGEVTVVRRCFRSGESEYFLNGSPSRLIDIQDLLSDSGLGREMYSIISQGKLDDVLNSKPAERRRLIEEAAGVLKHKKRKERALRKLVSMDDNLNRARDILKEIGRQLAPLEKQANAAEIFNRLNGELKTAETAIAVIDLRRYQSQWETLSSRINENVNIENGIKRDLEGVEAILAAGEEELESKSLFAGDIGEHRRRVEAISQKINSGLLLLEEKGRNLIERLSELRQKIYQLDRRGDDGAVELEQLDKDKAEADKELTALYTDLAELRKVSEQVKKDSRAAGLKFETVRRRLELERQRLDSLKEEAGKKTGAKQAANEQIEFLKTQLETASVRFTKIERQIESENIVMAEVETERRPFDEIIASGQRRIDRLIALSGQARKAHEDAVSDQNKRTAQIKALNELSAGLKPPTNAAVRLMSGETGRSGLLGMVGDMISVPARYEKAIEAVLAQDVYTLVSEDLPTISKTFASLEASDDEFISMIPAGGAGRDWGRPVKADWAVPALDVISCGEAVRPAIELLLKGVYIVDDLISVLRGHESDNAGFNFVSLKGEIITERGVVRRGLFKDDNIGLLGCQRELADLIGKEAEANRILSVCESTLLKAEDELKTEQERIMELTAAAQALDMKISAVAGRIGHLVEQLAAADDEQRVLGEKLLERREELSRIGAGNAEDGAELDGIKSIVAELEEELESLRRERESSLEKEAATTSQLGICQVGVASLTERQVHFKKRLLSLTADTRESGAALSTSRRAEAALENMRRRIQPVHDLYTELRHASESWEKILRELAEKELTETRDVRERIKSSQETARGLTERLETGRVETTEIRVEQGQLEVQVNNTIQHLVDDLQVPIEKALEIVPAEADGGTYEEKARRLRSQLARLGPVNPMASEEFTQMSERRLFLDKQIEDLQKSRRALEKVITAIDNKIKERFSITFAEVSRHLQTVFSELFPGGRVSLMLTEEDDISEAGIEIEAQPHGKALQALSLLSGGERSLVGLAFLFALYYTRPSPFYILDEVEAALDDANLQRLINLLTKLKADTQILIITHQRRTMETADSLYGVSMQADGVSQLVSQRLENDKTQGENGGERETELAEPAEVGSGQVTN